MASPPNGPAPSSPSDTSPGDRPNKRARIATESNHDGRSNTVPRRKTACHTCRMRKVKCTAERPVCSLCKTNGSVCEYDSAPGEKLTLETATQSLHERLDQLQQGLERLASAGLTLNGPSSSTPQPVYSPVQTHRQPSTSYPKTPTEPSRDFLQVPEHRGSADAVLTWQVFEGRYPGNVLIESLFKTEADDGSDDTGDVFKAPAGSKPLNEERIPQLVDAFLQNVHTKNPILDVESLVRHARQVATGGLGWDVKSCLVLLACALGSVARPFEVFSSSTAAQSASKRTEELQEGESYFVWACRRLGTLKHTILSSQCYFFAGVYLMYTLRPLLSWQYFTQASILYQLHMKTFYGLPTEDNGHQSGARTAAVSNKQRRLEQSLYWSCFKSESEFRVELPLPQSEIASYENPQMFPSPPSPANTDYDSGQVTPGRGGPNTGANLGSKLPNAVSALQKDHRSREDLELRRHTKELCNEEESWYYYLTEIALRRIGNRILNSFFDQEPSTWLDIRPLLAIAYELDAQVSSWSANLPPAMKQWESNYTIRAPAKETLANGKGDHVSTELSWAIDNRLLEVRSWLYQPFLYYLIHGNMTVGYGTRQSTDGHYPYDPMLMTNGNTVCSPLPIDHIATVGLNQNDSTVLRHLITSGIDCNIKILDVRSLRHRHHGLWFDLRSVVCASTILLGIVRSGHENLIPGGVAALWGETISTFNEGGNTHSIGGRIGKALDALEYWAVEAPDMVRHWEILTDVTKRTQEWWAGRPHVQ